MEAVQCQKGHGLGPGQPSQAQDIRLSLQRHAGPFKAASGSGRSSSFLQKQTAEEKGDPCHTTYSSRGGSSPSAKLDPRDPAQAFWNFITEKQHCLFTG